MHEFIKHYNKQEFTIGKLADYKEGAVRTVNKEKMKALKMAMATLALGATLSACQQHSERANLKTATDTLSYSIGYTNGVGMRKSISEKIPNGDSIISKDIMIAGFINGIMGDDKNTQLTEDEAHEVIQNYFKDLELRRKLEEADAYQKVKAQNEKYMAERAQEEGMVELPKPENYSGPGVLVKISEAGKGDTIGTSDYVYMLITSKLTDGQIIFQTPENEPKLIPIKGMVKGLQQGICTLKSGSIATIVVPSELGFGRQGMNSIPANSNLVYDVNILKIFHKEAEAKAFWKVEKEKRTALHNVAKDTSAKGMMPAQPAAPAAVKPATPAAKPAAAPATPAAKPAPAK